MRTPIQLLENVSHALHVPVWIKREDLFAVNGAAGSKVRKLVRILRAAEAACATDLVTAGTTGSHHVHAASVLGKAAGLGVHALLFPQPDLPYARSVHERIRSINKDLQYVSDFTSFVTALVQIRSKLIKNGRRPYYILPGGSSPEGIAAYRDAGLELWEDLRESPDVRPELQICVHGTGGIMAGLLCAGRVQPSLPPILGAAVVPGFWNRMLYVRVLSVLANFAREKAGPEATVPRAFQKGSPRGGSLDFRTVGSGYGTENPLCSSAVDLFETDGIFLDPVYMARAGQLVLDQAKRSPRPRGLLLWYTSPGRPV